MAKDITNIRIVSLLTVGSRVLGLVRDLLLMALLGAVYNSIFQFAFLLPNLLRRLLGEGALTSALVPSLSDRLEEENEQAAFDLLNKVLTRVFLVLMALVLLGGGLLWGLNQLDGFAWRWYWGFEIGIVLLPYMVLVCIAAGLAAGLYVFNHFAVASLSPVWLNLSMIVSLGGFAYMLCESPGSRLYYLSAGVLLGGALQVAIAAWALRKDGWRPRFDLSSSPHLTSLWKIFFPGLFGAAIFQINTSVSRTIAFALEESSANILYLSNRLIELPLGVFAVSVTTVVFPAISRCIAKDDIKGFAQIFQKGQRLILAIIIPASVGLLVLAEPVLQLFRWGEFTDNDVQETVPVLMIFAVGMPFYALATFLTRGFHALKDMRLPLHFAVVNFVSNVVFMLVLVKPLGVEGLSLANVLAFFLHSVLLSWFLRRKVSELKEEPLWGECLKILCATLVMGLVVYLGKIGMDKSALGVRSLSFVSLVILIPFGILVYVWILKIVSFKEAQDVGALLLKLIRFSKKRKQGSEK